MISFNNWNLYTNLYAVSKPNEANGVGGRGSSGIQGLVAAPAGPSFTGNHAHADHSKQLKREPKQIGWQALQKQRGLLASFLPGWCKHLVKNWSNLAFIMITNFTLMIAKPKMTNRA